MSISLLFRDRFRSELSHLYSVEEVRHLWRIFFESVTAKSALGLNLSEYQLPEDQLLKFNRLLSELKTGKPYQYILGKVPFVDLEISVEPGVLIPRPETEELIELIKSEVCNDDVRTILDIGTGSGCIALALAKHYKHAQVTALDISEIAISLAKRNAIQNKLELNVQKYDILNGNAVELMEADLIVSNPPYIARSESKEMSATVLEHEPALALFVPNNDPLLFYRKIGERAADILKPGGKLYFELNANYGAQTQQMFDAAGWSTKLYTDLSGNDRFLKVWA